MKLTIGSVRSARSLATILVPDPTEVYECGGWQEINRKDNQAAKELLEFAKNRLNKFYNPKLYKPPAMFMQVSMHKGKADPGPPPAAPGAHKKQDGGGVIAMIDTLLKELDTEMTEAEFNEKDAQEEYEEMMADSSAKQGEGDAEDQC